MSTDAIRQARSRQARKDKGMVEVRVWLSPQGLDALSWLRADTDTSEASSSKTIERALLSQAFLTGKR